ncbi:MAG: hypothetical protein ACREKR_01395 [Candidatus Methylomirabilales bacterium]
MGDLSKLPVWFLTLCVLYLGGLLTYAVYTGRPVKFFPPEIGPVDVGSRGMGRPGGNGAKTELYTIQGTLDLKTYADLKPELRDHLHELLLRVKPPVFEVDADGKFKIKNVPVIVEGNTEEMLLEVYPIKGILSKGYTAEAVRISSQPGTFGGESRYSLVFDQQNKTVTIMNKVSIKNPNKESGAPPY